MFADDEDGDFLSPTGGAKLASLFGLDQATSQGNESFQYTAPKQPRKTSMNSGAPAQKSAAPPGSPAVLLATAVHAFRYVNGQYMKQGKLGAAVLGNHTAKEYKLLLYASQQKQVTAARIHSGFIFTVQPSNYCTFYDDQRQNWSLMFESEKAATDFCKEVCLAKVNSAQLETVVTQDLVLGEGQGVENGDSLEVAYTGWLLQNHTIGQMFDSNLNKDKLLRLKLGAGKVIKGWEEGMLSMRKGGKRLMVIPPALAYGSQGVPGRVPADSTLVFEAEIRRVKFAKESSSERLTVGSRDSAIPSPAPSLDSLGPDLSQQAPSNASAPSKPSEPPLRAKSNSLSEQLSNPDATKAKLISRMAKMGQPMLPFLTGTASSSSQAESSDSELEDPSVSRLKERPAAPSPQPVHLSSAPSASIQATALMPVSMATANPQPVMPAAVHAFQPCSYTQSTVAPSHLQPVGQMYPTQTVPYQGSGDVTSFLMTEARQHNTEIRLAVGKVADKVDQLSAKMEELHKQGGLSLGLSNVSMETAMIMHNIQRIIQENECLKKEVFEKSSRIEEQNRKIGELINQNQRYMEQSNMLMEQRNDSMKSSSEQSQARILQAEQDKARLTEELASSTARVTELQLELTAQRQKSAGLQTSLSAALQEGQQHSEQIKALESQLQELKEAAEQTQNQSRAEKQKRKEAELKLSNLDEELQDLKSEKESLERTLLDRKRKWQAERQRCDEELEEVRKASQLELDNLRSQLRKARTSTDHAAAEQLAQMQADVEREWQAKCEQALASAREQQSRQLSEITEQRDALQLKLTQLQEKFSALKQSRDEEEQRLLQQQEQGEELQALKEKCSALEQRAQFLRQQGETRVLELERRLAEQQQQTDTAGEVKRVMNGVFHSLRGEFDLHETYTGSDVLKVLVNTIKNVTLQLLSKAEPSPTQMSEKEEDEEEEEEESKSEPQPENIQQALHVNGSKEEEAEGQVLAKEERSDVPEKVEQKEGDDGEAEEEKGEQEVVRENEEVQEIVSTKVEQETLLTDGDSEAPQIQTENEVISEDDVNAAPACDITPEEEVKVDSESVVDPKSEPDESKPTGPPKNPPPPPKPLQEDNTATATQPISSSERVEGGNSEDPFFQSPAPTKPPPPPTTEEEEEELSLKGRPPPAPLFGDDSDEDDLDWLG
ncbi:LOW QUALITY PROTEIN: FK506-binding protein 15 [Colossoma macropomum]|uniref:LOW QUALITY PROTEIN: FK506-binding protein 15 n=1 Tax=Colossoma macropomum TaxID=42526 RepID=UPI0018641910|nr:LOW QUALITY PROTEIN: FK506-binding protein 15 [Colossoma macropomum]